MSIINNHNKKLLHPHTNNKDLPCNCRTFPTAHALESAEQSPSSTKHPSVLPTHPPNIILVAAKLNSDLFLQPPTILQSLRQSKRCRTFQNSMEIQRQRNRTLNNLVNLLAIYA